MKGVKKLSGVRLDPTWEKANEKAKSREESLPERWQVCLKYGTKANGKPLVTYRTIPGKNGKSSYECVCAVKRRFDSKKIDLKQGVDQIPSHLVDIDRLLWMAGLLDEGGESIKEKPKIKDLVDEYLDFRESIVRKDGEPRKRGTINKKTYASDVSRLRSTFMGYVNRRGISLLERVNTAKFWEEYRKHIKKTFGSDAGQRLALVTFQSMMKWGWKTERIEGDLPRICEGYVDITPSKPNPMPFTKGEIHALIKEADPLTRACLMLGLNCAFTLSNCHGLTNKSMHWDKGILEKDRDKTNVYCVYTLWPETLLALQAIRNKDRSPNSHVLLRENGMKLETEKGNNCVSKRVEKLIKELVASGKLREGLTFGGAKRAASTLIEDKVDMNHSDIFLAHAIQSMSVHYNERKIDSSVWRRLADATNLVRNELAIAEAFREAGLQD